MPSKEELRDGPFVITTVSKKTNKKNSLSPLKYCSLSGLAPSKTIKIEKLKNHAKIIRDNISVDEDKTYEVIDLADIDKSTGEITNISKQKGDEISYRKAKFFRSDVIFGKIRPYLNNVAIVDKTPTEQKFFIGSSEWVRIKPKKLPYYLLLALRSKFTLFQTSVSKGSVRPRFSPDKLPEIEIPILKNEDLSTFLNFILQRIFKIRNFCNNNLTHLLRRYGKLSQIKTKKEILINKVLRSDINKARMDGNYYLLQKLRREIKKQKHDKLGNLVSFSNKKVREEYNPGDTFEYITTRDADPNQGEIVHWEEKVYKPKSYVSNKTPGRAQMVLKENQILIPYLKLSTESVAWIPKDLENYIGSNGFAVLEAKNKNDFGFIYLVLRSSIIQDQLKLIAAGTIMEDIDVKNLKNLVIFVPEKKTREQFSDHVKDLLEIKWRTRKLYGQLISIFEEFCSNIIDERKFFTELERISEALKKVEKHITSPS